MVLLIGLNDYCQSTFLPLPVGTFVRSGLIARNMLFVATVLSTIEFFQSQVTVDVYL